MTSESIKTRVSDLAKARDEFRARVETESRQLLIDLVRENWPSAVRFTCGQEVDKHGWSSEYLCDVIVTDPAEAGSEQLMIGEQPVDTESDRWVELTEGEDEETLGELLALVFAYDREDRYEITIEMKS